jgi:hypothetical protein
MSVPKLYACIFTGALCAISACSKTASNGGATIPRASASATPVKAGTVCDRKLLTVDDVAGILSKPITGTKPLKGDPQTCYFITADDDRGGPDLMVSLRPGLGVVTLATFTSGKMDAYARSVPLAGVGDGAVWKPDLKEVTAQKNNVLCEVRPGPLSMSVELTRAGEAAQQRTLGALCNKIFAAY